MRFAMVLGALALSLGGAANAATVVNTGSVGSSFTIDFTGQAGGAPAPQLDATLTMKLTEVSADLKSYTFAYTISNDSTVESRLRAFGFNVIGATVTGASATGTFSSTGLNNNFPEGVGELDVCVRMNTGSNCTGGNGGLARNTSGTGTLALALAAPANSLSLGNFTVRYQSINPSVNGATSAVGIGTVQSAVPEPTTWAMLLVGFAGVGGLLRRRRQDPRLRTALV